MTRLYSATRSAWGVASFWLLATLLATPATAAEKNWQLTSIAFSSGSASVNGYVSAGTALDFEVRHCGEGTIYLVAGIRRNTAQMDSRYWYKGKLRNIPPAMVLIQPEHMWVRGKAIHGIQSATFGGRIGLSDKASCWFDGMPLPSTPKGVKGDDFARSFTIRFEQSETVLRNEAFEKYADGLDAQEREAEAARQKQEAERQKQEAERQKQEAAAARQKQEAERLAKVQLEKAAAERAAAEPRKSASGAGMATAGTTAAATTGGQPAASADAFWGDAPATAATCGEPQYVTSGNRYFLKDCRGRLQEVNMDDYYHHRKQVAERQQTETRAERERAAGAALQRLQQQQQAAAAEAARQTAELDTRMSGLRSAYAAGSRLEEARGAVRDLSQLQASYDSLQALDSDFQSRMESLHDRFDDMRAANREKIDAGVEAIYGNEHRAYGEVAGMVAQMASENALDKERKAARAEMYRQKEQLERNIEAARKAGQLQLRKDLLATFADSPIPLSSQKVAADTLYFFAYSAPADALPQEHPGLAVTSVFPVARRGDGGWPFKRSFNEDLRPLTRGEVAWTGHFTSSAEAESARQRFLDFARKGGFAIREVEYGGRPAPGGGRTAERSRNASGSGPDFWGEAPRQTSTAGDDFW